MISEDQINQIKQQLIHQIKTSFPEDKQISAIQEIQSMDQNQLIEFLKQNKLIKDESDLMNQQHKCIFCAIINGEIPSYKIAENKKAIAVLEIRPLSKGHTLIIPKQHIKKPEDIPKEAQDLSAKIVKVIKSKLKPSNIQVKIINSFGHEIINLIPIYEKQELNEKRTPAQENELKELQKKLLINTHAKKINEKEKPCIFCSIAQGKTPSYKLGDNKTAIAVLEVNPVSRGHTLVIPLKHIKSSGELPSQAQTLAKKIAKKIQSKLKPKNVQIVTSNISGHEIINVLPIYQEETINSKRTPAKEDDLKVLQNLLKITKKTASKTQQKKQEKIIPWEPKRIP